MKFLLEDSDTITIEFVVNPREKTVREKQENEELKEGETIIKTTWGQISFGVQNLIEQDSLRTDERGDLRFDPLLYSIAHLKYCLQKWDLDKFSPFLKVEREKVPQLPSFRRLTESCLNNIMRTPSWLLSPIIRTAMAKLRLEEEAGKELGKPQEPSTAAEG